MTESAGVMLAVAREVFELLERRALDVNERNFEAVLVEVCERRGMASGGTDARTPRGWKDLRDELVALSQTCLDFVGRLAGDHRDLLEALTRLRRELSTPETRRVRAVREELSSQLSQVPATVQRVNQHRTFIKGVLRTLADQLRAANAGSEVFEARAEEIRRRVEQAESFEDLQALQSLLVEAAATAGREARQMRAEMNRLSRQVAHSMRQIDDLEQALAETRREASVDPLTRVPNRRALEGWVAAHLYADGGLARPYCLLVIDLDHFKHINDTHGHLAGDRALCHAARRLLSGIREKDFLARFGGEEFVVVLPDCELRIAEAVGERLRQLLERRPAVHEGVEIPITASIGVAEARAAEHFRDTFDRADRCVYVAKESGRNRVVSERGLADPDETPREPPPTKRAAG